jgi:hypothetical protein
MTCTFMNELASYKLVCLNVTHHPLTTLRYPSSKIRSVLHTTEFLFSCSFYLGLTIVRARSKTRSTVCPCLVDLIDVEKAGPEGEHLWHECSVVRMFTPMRKFFTTDCAGRIWKPEYFCGCSLGVVNTWLGTHT